MVRISYVRLVALGCLLLWSQGNAAVPTALPSAAPTSLPSTLPTSPSYSPTIIPVPYPTGIPIPAPTLVPIPLPTPVPNPVPSSVPMPAPTYSPTLIPSSVPTGIPPTSLPSPVPFPNPTHQPSSSPPTPLPSATPTVLPYPNPTPSPSLLPSPRPTLTPVPAPTAQPTTRPTTTYRSRLYFERSIAVNLPGSSTSAWTTSQSNLYQEALENAFPEVDANDVVQLGVFLHTPAPSMMPTTTTASSSLAPTVSVRRRNLLKKQNDEESKRKLSEINVEAEANIQNLELMRRKLTAAAGTVDLDIRFSLTLTSSETDVAIVTSTVDTKLETLFVNGGFDSFLSAAASTLGVMNNITVLAAESSILLNSNLNDVVILDLITAQPTVIPTPPPTVFPSLLPTSQPTVRSFLGFVDVEVATASATIAASAAIGASVVASVGSSVGASVGASTGASTGASAGASSAGSSGSSGSSSSNSGGDPLSLILLVQFIHITAKLTSMPESYTEDFAESFAIFNLEIAPPKIAKNFMKFDWAGKWFDDDSQATETMRGQLFYMVVGEVILFLLHCFFLLLLKCYKGMNEALPEELLLPHFEIACFIAFSMGMLDVSLGVLASTKSSSGWKIIAGVEVLFALLFIAYFIKKGFDFKRTMKFQPLANVKILNREHDAENDAVHEQSNFTLKDVERIYEKHGLKRSKARKMWKKHLLDDEAHMSYSDLALFAATDVEGDILPHKIPFNQTSWYEGLYAMVFMANRDSGVYVPLDPFDDSNVSFFWEMHYNKFTPNHQMYYFMNVLRTLLALTILNFLIHEPIYQVSLLVALEFICFCFLLKDGPYVHIMDTRCEMVTGLGRFLIYFFVLLPSLIDDKSVFDFVNAEQAVISIELLILIHCIYTQLYPFFAPFLLAAVSCVTLCFLRLIRGPMFDIESDSDSESDSDDEFQLPCNMKIGDAVTCLVEGYGNHIDPRQARQQVKSENEAKKGNLKRKSSTSSSSSSSSMSAEGGSCLCSFTQCCSCCSGGRHHLTENDILEMTQKKNGKNPIASQPSEIEDIETQRTSFKEANNGAEAKKERVSESQSRLQSRAESIKVKDIKVGAKGVVVGACPKSEFPSDFEKRVLVKFSNNIILGLIARTELEKDSKSVDPINTSSGVLNDEEAVDVDAALELMMSGESEYSKQASPLHSPEQHHVVSNKYWELFPKVKDDDSIYHKGDHHHHHHHHHKEHHSLYDAISHLPHLVHHEKDHHHHHHDKERQNKDKTVAAKKTSGHNALKKKNSGNEKKKTDASSGGNDEEDIFIESEELATLAGFAAPASASSIEVPVKDRDDDERAESRSVPRKRAPPRGSASPARTHGVSPPPARPNRGSQSPMRPAPRGASPMRTSTSGATTSLPRPRPSSRLRGEEQTDDTAQSGSSIARNSEPPAGEDYLSMASAAKKPERKRSPRVKQHQTMSTRSEATL